MKKTMNRKPAARRGPAKKGTRELRTSPGPIDPDAIIIRDLMKTDVLVLSRNDTIHQAAERLEDVHVSGAPVVDDRGKLVGVLTLSDLARSEHVSEAGVSSRFEGRQSDAFSGQVDVEGEDEELVPSEQWYGEVQGNLCVADWMTPGVIQVAPERTLAEVCRVMLDEDIHRVFVVENDQLVGVFSTEDIVRLIAQSGR